MGIMRGKWRKEEPGGYVPATSSDKLQLWIWILNMKNEHVKMCPIMGILEYNSCGEYEEMRVELHLLVDQWVRESMWILGLEKLKMEKHDWVWNMCECFDSVALTCR